MRVIAGKAKGRRLYAPKGSGTRPTSDRVKESLFSILGSRVAGAEVLDLYAGSGALGIEAVSRGASRAVFVEEDPRAIEALKRNLDATGFTDLCAVESTAVDAALKSRMAGRRFDLIFLDPPYRIDRTELARVVTAAARCLTERGAVILEHEGKLPRLELDGSVEIVDDRRYGDTGLTFFEEQEN